MCSIPKTTTDRTWKPISSRVGFLVCVGLIWLLACRDGGRGPTLKAHGHSEPQHGGILRFSVPTGVATLDPAVGYDEIAFYAIHHVHDTLLGHGTSAAGQGSQLVPQLAESWSVSPDGTVYSFVLRPGLRYSDGRPCVSGDFKYAGERALTLPKGPFGQYFRNVVGATDLMAGKASELEGVRVFDDRHFEVRLVEPDSAFPMILAMMFTTPMSRAHVEEVGSDIRRKPLGTGPFALVRWSEGTELVFARNPYYWDRPLPYLDGMVMYTSVPRETAFLKFEAGELDTVARLSSADYLWLAERPDWQPYTEKVLFMNTVGVRMNCQRPPFDDARVRRAMNYAINKQHIVKLHNGRARIASSILPPLMFGHNSDLLPYPHHPERARQLLAEAGYPDGFAVEYFIFQDGPNEQIAQSMQVDLRRVGVDMTIRLVSFPTLITAIGKPDGSRFSFMGWSSDYPDPTNFIDTNFHSRMIADEHSNNNTFYENPRLDRMIDAAKRERDAGRRERMYRDIDQLLHHEAPWVWLFHLAMVEVKQPYVANYKPHPIWLRDFRAAWLDLAPQVLRGQR